MHQEREPQPQLLTLEFVVDFAREIMLRDGEIPPTLIAEGSRQMVTGQFPELPPHPDERVRFMFTAGYALAENFDLGRLEQLFFLCEAWMSMGEDKLAAGVRPSEDPQHREILLVSQLVMSDGRGAVSVCQLIRDEGGDLVELRDLGMSRGGSGAEIESPLLDAFVAGFTAGSGLPRTFIP